MKTLVLALTASVASAALADYTEYVRERTSGQQGTVNWTDATGWQGGVAPNLDDESGKNNQATLVNSSGKYQVIKLPTSEKAHYLGYLTGGENTVIGFAKQTRQLWLGEVGDFLGMWAISAGGDAGLDVAGVVSGDVTVGKVDVTGRFRLRVQDGVTARVTQLSGGGGFDVNNVNGINPSASPWNAAGCVGTLVLANVPGHRAFANVAAGKLVVPGASKSAAPVPGAWLRLDAADESTMTLQDGRVTEWRDADGRDLKAIKAGSYNAPVLTEESVGPAVNFGVFQIEGQSRGDAAVDGSPAILELTRSSSEVCELFVVYRENQIITATDFAPVVCGRELDETKVAGAFGRSWNHPEVLFHPRTELVDGLALGEFTLDGQQVRPDADCRKTVRDGSLHVLTAGYEHGGGTVSLLAGDRFGESSRQIGGVRIAEILLYTNRLTSAERRLNVEYLQRKWFGAVGDGFAGLRLGATAELEVDGGELSVGWMANPGKTLVKSGSGDLTVGRAEDNLDAVTVNGGSVNFAAAVEIGDDPRPAADPYIWCDPSVEASRETFPSNYLGRSLTFVTSLNDVREGATNHLGEAYSWSRYPFATQKAFVGGAGVLAYPTLDTEVGGRPMVDIGPFFNYGNKEGTIGTDETSGLSTYLHLYKKVGGESANTANENRARAIYAVFYKTGSKANVLQSGDWGMRQTDGSTGFIAGQYASDLGVQGGHWTYDGKTVEPTSVSVTADGSVHVVALYAEAAAVVNFRDLGPDMGIGGGGNFVGGVKFGEILAYDRVLTAQERIDTERYLLKKWTDKVHPLENQTLEIGTLTYAEGVTPKLRSDRNLHIARLISSAPLEVTGSGKVTIGDMGPGMTALAADGVELKVGFEVADGAAFRVDASRLDTLEFENGAYDPAADANPVLRWNDARGNGWYASAEKSASSGGYAMRAVAKPNLRLVTINGAEKPCLDFGEFHFQGGDGDLTNATAAAMAWSSAPSFRNGFIVCADSSKRAGSGNDRQSIFGETTFRFFRNSSDNLIGAFDASNMPLRSPDAYIGVDGEAKDRTFAPVFQQFYVYAFTPTSAVDRVNWFAQSRKDRWGGQQICEAIVFSDEITGERRTEIENYLMKKWLGTGAGVSRELTEISVANAGVLDAGHDDGLVLVTPLFGGSGSITTPAVSGITTLRVGEPGETAGSLAADTALSVAADAVIEVGVGADGSVGTMTVAGGVDFAGPVTVRLVPAAEGQTVALGRFAIVGDPACTADISGWTLDASQVGKNRTYRLVKDAAGVLLSVTNTGIIMYVQ